MKKLILLIMLLTMSVSVFAVGTPVLPQNAKYQFTPGLTYKACDFVTHNLDGSVKRDYGVNSGYLSMNHRTNQLQCYQLLNHRGGHKKVVKTVVNETPVIIPPVCTTKITLFCSKGYELKGDNCEKKTLETPICNWPYNLNSNNAWCVRPYHESKTPSCEQGNFKIIDHHGYCEVNKVVVAQKACTEICN